MNPQKNKQASSHMVKTLKICYFGTYRSEYSRNQIMIEGLQRAGVEVVICHEPLWHSIEDRVQIASGGWSKPAFWLRIFRCYRDLTRKYLTIGDYDILVVGYPGQLDVFWARLLSWLRKKPLVWDILNSMFLIMTERGIAKRHSFTASLVHFAERIACRLPDLLLLDTVQFINWFHHEYNAPIKRFRVVPIGVDINDLPNALATSEVIERTPDGIFRVIYYGTFIANHGVDIIIESARLLQDDYQIHFEIIGTGPTREAVESLVKRYDIRNVTLFDWMSKEKLAVRIAQADLCLGAFGNTLQASLTNNNKVYEAFSLKKPVITGKSPALPTDLIHGIHLYLCDRGNPKALAKAIRILKGDPELCNQLGENGYKILLDKFDTIHIGRLCLNYLNEFFGEI